MIISQFTSGLQEFVFGREVKKIKLIFITQVSDNLISDDVNALVDIMWSTP